MNISRRSALKGIAAGAAGMGMATGGSGADAAELAGAVDVVVVGAGAAGTNAARNLLEAGRSFVLLEANDRVGGRLMRGKIAGQDIDLGGQWVGPTQTRALELGAEFGLEMYPTFREGTSLIELGGKTYRGEINLPQDAALEFFRVSTTIDKMGGEIMSSTPWKIAKAKELDAITAHSWFEQNIQNPQTKELMRVIVQAVNSCEPSQISFLQFASMMSTGGTLAEVIGTAGGAQQDLFVGGFIQIPELLAKELGDNVVLGAPVRAIEQDDEGVRVRSDKGTWKAQRVIVTAPPNTAGRIEYSPTLPYTRVGLMERMPMGSVIKCFVAYETPFWREKGLNGQGAMASAEFGAFFDTTPPGTPHGILSGFFDGGPAQRWSDRSSAERKERVTEDIATALGKKALSPIDYVDQNWPRERWSQGGYACVPGPGVLTYFGEAIRKPCGRIHWAGTETSERWYGYVEGALHSGDRVAREVVELLHA